MTLTKASPGNIGQRKSGRQNLKPSVDLKADVIRMELLGADKKGPMTGVDPLPGTANYFFGNNPANWHTGVPTFGRVRYASMYPGVDLAFYGNQKQLEFDFILAPHASAKPIRLHFGGARNLKLTRTGDLEVEADNGSIAFRKPIVYQIQDGKRQLVDGRFVVLARHTAGFALGSYDRSRELVIDPTLSYSTYLGGYNETAAAIAVDSSGSTYVVGSNFGEFPATAGAFQTVDNGSGVTSAFVAKLNPAGTALVYATYLGGSGGDSAAAVAVDSSGNAYVAGTNNSIDFPVTPGALQTVYNSPNTTNGFISKLNSSGTELVYSTYLGGAGASGNILGYYPAAVAIDAGGDLFVAGSTQFNDFPVTPGAFQTVNNFAPGYNSNAFVCKLNPSGTAFIYSTYLGGSGNPAAVVNLGDFAVGIAVDSSGDAYVAGVAYSTNFPITSSAFQQVNNAATNSGSNAFITKFNPSGTALVYSTYLGGSSGDGPAAIALDALGDAFVTGTAGSNDFPVTAGAYQKVNRGADNQDFNSFVTKLNAAGSALVYSTYLGGTGYSGDIDPGYGDQTTGIAVDTSGHAFVTGLAISTDFPITPGAFQTVNNGASNFASNGFLTELNPTGSLLVYSSYLGGSGYIEAGGYSPQGDSATAIALDSSGDVYLTGDGYSTDFPVTPGSLQTLSGNIGHLGDGLLSAFVSKFDLGSGSNLIPTSTILTANGNPQNAGSIVTFTASVTPATGNGVPTGNVGFSVAGGAYSMVPLDDTGHASYPAGPLAAGYYSVIASYSGDSKNAPSTASFQETMTQAPSITVVSGSGQTAVYGSAGFTSPLAVAVRDAEGNALATTVTFSGTGLSFPNGNTITTYPGTADASVEVQATRTGSLTATASAYGVSGVATFSLNETKALLTVTANNVNIASNQSIPPLTYTITGFVNGDTLSVVSGSPSETTTATQGSPNGSYPITLSQGTLAAANYNFQFVNGTIAITPSGPVTNPVFAAAVNPVTNKVYVANQSGSSVTVTDPSANTTAAVTVGSSPVAVAVNAVTNNIYVANYNSGSVTVIAGANNTTTTIAVGANPIALAVNPVTNKIYVANFGSANITVIDGATDTTSTLPAGTNPDSVAVNPVTNKIYVANNASSSVTVIDGANNTLATVAVGTNPVSVAVNALTNDIYVANHGSSNVTMINGATNGTTTVAAGSNPYSVAVNPLDNTVYVVNNGSNDITVINGSSNVATTIAVGSNPEGIAVNAATNEIYVANEGNDTLTVINGANNSTKTVPAGTNPSSVAVNPVTNKIYVANLFTSNVTAIDGATNSTATVSVGTTPIALAVNPVTNEIYVSNYFSKNVTVIDGATNSTATVTVGGTPEQVAVNPVTNKIYVSNYSSNSVTVIDGATNTTTTVPAGANPLSIAVNPVTNNIYVANYGSNTVTVINGATNQTSTVDVGANPSWVAVNPVTDRIYVADGGSDAVTVINGDGNSTTTIPVGTMPLFVAVNPVTDKIYVANDSSNNVTVIDGATNTTTTVAAGASPGPVAVNTLTNKIYVVNYDSADVTVIDGAANTTTTVGVGLNPLSVAVNPASNKVYVGNDGSGESTVTVIDGNTNATTSVAAGSYPQAVAVNPVTNQIYTGNSGGGTVTVIAEAQVQPIPLTTTVTPLTNNQTATPTPGFSFTAQSSTVSVPSGVYFQTDTLGSAWTAATGNNPTFTGTVISPLQPGFHILYSYAVDGEEATATQPGSPLSGAIQAYGFLVTQPVPAVVSLSPTSARGQSQTFAATYTDPNGLSDFSSVRVLLNTSVNGTSACYAQYVPSTNALYLENNTNNGLLGPLTPGSSSSLSNSQCTLSGAGTTVSTNGDTITVNFAITFLSAFAGPKNVYLAAYTATTNTGFILKGTYTVLFGSPMVVSLSPTAATGSAQVFTAEYADPNGLADLATVRLLLNTSVNGVNACYAFYDPPSNSLYLENNANNGLIGPLTPGSASSISNSQCSLSGAGTTVTTSGNNITVNFSLTFLSGFESTKNVYLAAYGAIANSGFIQEGSYTVYFGAPGDVSVSPSSGTGSAQTFSAVYADPNGISDLATVRLLINSAVSGVNACYAEYAPATNALYLEDNTNNGLLGPLTPGSSSSISNSQCRLEGSGTTVTTSGNNITVAFNLTFLSGFAGAKNVYLAAYGATTNSGFIQKGTYTISFGAPTVTSLSPASGTGESQVFSAVYSDPNGISDLASVRLLFNTSVNGVNACYVEYFPSSNALYLENNSNNGLIGPLTPGSSSAISNSQCSLEGTGSKVTTNGNSITADFNLTFSSGFTGQKNAYLAAYSASTNSGFILEGTWTP